MAELIALRAALVRMGLTAPAAQFATNDIGLNTLDEWCNFQCDDDLYYLTKNLRSPGAGVPGFQVSVRVIGNLKVMRLALQHHRYTQRPIVAGTITLDWIRDWAFLVEFRKQAKKQGPEDDDLPKIIKNDWAQTKENIITHFSGIYGDDGIPFAALLRETVAVPANAEDPHDGYDGDYNKELIQRAPHEGAAYNANNRTLCRLLKKICINTPAYTYISRMTNGRNAWETLMQTYLGPQHTQNQATIWEAKLQNSTYTGESARFTYDAYWEIHKQAHQRLDGLTDQGYHGMDEGTKIRYFLAGIKTDKLKSVKELVHGNASFNTFDLVARRIKDSVTLLKPTSERKVSDVQRSESGRGQEEPYADVEADMSMEDKFYRPEAWAKLTNAQRKGVLLKRKKRKGKTSNKPPPKPIAGEKRSLKKMKKKIAALTKQVSSMNVAPPADPADDADASSSDSDDSAPVQHRHKRRRTATPNNRTANPAINRPRRR